jgi:hypothetical protein
LELVEQVQEVTLLQLVILELIQFFQLLLHLVVEVVVEVVMELLVYQEVLVVLVVEEAQELVEQVMLDVFHP